MKKSTLIISTLAVVFACGTAHAQSFTYESEVTETKTLGGVGPDGTDYMGVHSKGKSNAVNADGSKRKSTYECVSMASPENSKLFDAHMACDITADDGTFSLVAGCNAMNAEGTEAMCVGGMRGKSGAYEGRNGNLSQHSKDGKSNGSGQWFE